VSLVNKKRKTKNGSSSAEFRLNLFLSRPIFCALKTHTAIIALFVCFFPLLALATDTQQVSFYVIQPGGDGSTEEAKPYLLEFFDYLREQTGTSFDGLYINSKNEAVTALQNKGVQLAIVSPEFIATYRDRFNFISVLKTIPIYSSGPYEKYFIMTNKATNLIDLADQNTKVSLYTSGDYDGAFLNNVIFGENEMIKKISWQMIQSPDVLNIIKEIDAGKTNTFVLLTGYEFSVIQQLKRSNSLPSLQLVFSSTELPSSHVVTLGSGNTSLLGTLKTALVNMPNSLKGNMILKHLRLKGFAE